MKINIGPYPDGDEERQVEIQIDDYDVWSMDSTLALIVYPMLKLLKEKKHGAPYTEDSDVPEAIRSTSAKPKENDWDTDEFHFARWDYILDEMIWGFEQLNSEDDESKFFTHHEYDPATAKGIWKTLEVGAPTIDEQGLQDHQKRKANAFRLFGTYLQSLWD